MTVEGHTRRIERSSLAPEVFAALDGLRRMHPGGSALVFWLLADGRTSTTPRPIPEVMQLLDAVVHDPVALPAELRVVGNIDSYLARTRRAWVLEDARAVRDALAPCVTTGA